MNAPNHSSHTRMFDQTNSTFQTIRSLALSNTSNLFIQLQFSSTVRLTRHLLHVIILILFFSILAFVDRKRHHFRTPIRPFSQISRLIVFSSIIGLVFDDLLVINGVTRRIWCSIHQAALHLLLTTIQAGRLLPDVYEHAYQYYRPRDSSILKCGVMFTFISLMTVQLLISLRWSLNDYDVLNLPTFCVGSIRSQLLIFILHILDFLFTVQSIRLPGVPDDVDSFASTKVLITEKFCRLNSILVRLYYFMGTCILQIFFLPGQFSGTLYGGVLVIEFVLKYLINVYQSTGRGENSHTGYLRLKNDDLSDDTRLLNDIN